MKNNPIFQVLVVSNPTILTTGQGLDALSIGQLGAFNAETNLSFDPTGAIPDKFYLAVGHAKDGIRKSAGEYIRRAKVNEVSGKAPVTAVPQEVEVDLTNFVPEEDTDYTIRVSFQSGQTAQMHGFDNLIKSFTIVTPSVAPNLTSFIYLLVAEINADDEYPLLHAANSAGTSLIVTVGAEDKENTIGGINPHYSFLRQFNVTLACTNGFQDQPDLFTIRNSPPVYEEGSGYEIQQLEYVAGGWNGKPGIYRESELLGLFAAGNFVPLAAADSQYYQLWLNYELLSNSGGMLNYSNQVETLIAIPNDVDEEDFSPALNSLTTFAGTLTGQTNTAGTVQAYNSEA